MGRLTWVLAKVTQLMSDEVGIQYPWLLITALPWEDKYSIRDGEAPPILESIFGIEFYTK